jgi:hypothetical protein
MGRGAVRGSCFVEGPTPWPHLVVGVEATLKVCGVGVAMLPGYSWVPAWLIEQQVNVGTVRGRPIPDSQSGERAGPLPTEGHRVGRRSRSSPSTREACTWRRGPVIQQWRMLECRERRG